MARTASRGSVRTSEPAEAETTTLVPPSPTTEPSTGREGFIDATRGTAMFFVCLSHFSDIYLGRVGAFQAQRWLHTVSRVASPTFLLVSGFTLGWLYRTRSPQRFSLFTRKLLDRGLFLLSAGHVLIWLAHQPLVRREGTFEFWGFITDAIAVCLIVGGAIVPRTGALARAGLAAGLYALSWTLFDVWSPTGSIAIALKALLFGIAPSPQHPHVITFPIVPWFAVYLLASVVGERVVPTRGREFFKLLLGGAAAALLGFAGHVASHRLVSNHVFTLEHPVTRLLSAGQKFPPGPAYLLLYGGLGAVLLGVMAWLEQGRRLVRVLALCARAGQASLVLFIAQYFVYMAGLSLIELSWTPWWPLYFAASALGLFWFGDAFQRRFGSRLFSVGLGAWARRETCERVASPRRHSTG